MLIWVLALVVLVAWEIARLARGGRSGMTTISAVVAVGLLLVMAFGALL